MIKVISALALVAFSTQALANQEEAKALKASAEIPNIEALIGKDLKIAGSYRQSYEDDKMKLVEVAADEKVMAVMNHYAFGDINGDDVEDLAVAVEMKPKTEADGYMLYGERSLRIYLGDANGSLKLYQRNANAILNGDEGGVMGDPLQTVEINQRGVVIVNHYGGSAQKWGVTQKYQMRKGELVLIGLTNDNYDGVRGEIFKEDINLITGNKITTSGNVESEKPLKVKQTKVAVKPLVKFVNAKVWAD